jgi:hypothetical protein
LKLEIGDCQSLIANLQSLINGFQQSCGFPGLHTTLENQHVHKTHLLQGVGSAAAAAAAAANEDNLSVIGQLDIV